MTETNEDNRRWAQYLDEVKALLLEQSPPVALIPDSDALPTVLDNLLSIVTCYREGLTPEEAVAKTHRDIVRSRILNGTSLVHEVTIIEDGMYYHYGQKE